MSGTQHQNLCVGEFVDDILSGKERVIPFSNISGPAWRNTTMCALIALNFARLAFQHQRRTRGLIGTFIGNIAKRTFIEDVLSVCDQVTPDVQVDIADLYRLPVFKRNFDLEETKHGFYSVLLLKNALRDVQKRKTPAAVLVSRGTDIILCMKIPAWTTTVFFALELQPGRVPSSGLNLVASTSLEKTVGRMFGAFLTNNPLLNVLRHTEQAACVIYTFAPVLHAGSSQEDDISTMAHSMTVLRSWADAAYGQHSEDGELIRSPPGKAASRRDAAEQPSTSRGRMLPSDAGSPDSGMRTRIPAFLSRARGFLSYETTKRYGRIFLYDDSPDRSSCAGESGSNNVDDLEVIQEEEVLECGICFERVQVSFGIRLEPCQHWVCRVCIIGHICAKIDARRFPVFCPMCTVDPKNANPSTISGTLVQKLGLTDAQYSTWAELEMADLSVPIHCRSCNRSAYVDKRDHDSLDRMICPFPGCNHTWCKNCQQTIIPDGPKHSCDGSSELKDLVKRMGWKHCPKCKTLVQKTGGCNHMTCVTPGCNSHFCYTCGKQIVRSPIQFIVSSAIAMHYRHCTL